MLGTARPTSSSLHCNGLFPYLPTKQGGPQTGTRLSQLWVLRLPGTGPGREQVLVRLQPLTLSPSLSVSKPHTHAQAPLNIIERKTSWSLLQFSQLSVCLLASAWQGWYTDARRRGREQEGFCPHDAWPRGGSWETRKEALDKESRPGLSPISVCSRLCDLGQDTPPLWVSTFPLCGKYLLSRVLVEPMVEVSEHLGGYENSCLSRRGQACSNPLSISWPARVTRERPPPSHFTQGEGKIQKGASLV